MTTTKSNTFEKMNTQTIFHDKEGEQITAIDKKSEQITPKHNDTWWHSMEEVEEMGWAGEATQQPTKRRQSFFGAQ